jgi:hypothetical protein
LERLKRRGRVPFVSDPVFFSPRDFRRYEAVSDSIYRKLKDLNRLGLQVEKQMSRHPDVDHGAVPNYLGGAYSRLDKLIEARDLSVDEAWRELELLLELTERAICDVRRQLDADQ